jgi:hypothetical protein
MPTMFDSLPGARVEHVMLGHFMFVNLGSVGSCFRYGLIEY